jgi:hypothetical protein
MDFRPGTNQIRALVRTPVALAALQPTTMISSTHPHVVADALSSRYRFEREIGAGGMAT